MRIFLIARGYPTLEAPQWGCFEKDQAEALVAAGHEVTILGYRQRPFNKYIGFYLFNHNNVNVVSYCIFPGRIFGNFGARLRTKIERWQLDKAYKLAVKLYGEPDLLYSHYLFVTDIATYIKDKYKKPLVAIEHWSEVSNPLLLPYVKKIGQRTYSKVDKLISVSNSLKEAINDRFGYDSIVVHNLIGKEFTFNVKQVKSEKLHFVSTGSLIYRKGYDLLIDAFAKSCIDKAKWSLTIIGDGPERSRLEKRIHELELADNIKLPGGTNKEGIVKILMESDVFILPSRNENFSVSVLEALSCGLPVIASICGGIRECIDKHNGLLFPVDDVDSLAECLLTMYNNYSSYSRENISLNAYEKYAPLKIAKLLTDIFKSSNINKYEEYTPGEKVIHDKYGEGVIINVDKSILTIAFAHPHGIVKIMRGHKSLKKI